MSENRWIHSQRPSSTRLVIDTRPSEFSALVKSLESLLGGNDKFYAWACTLSDEIILNAQKYMDAMKAKIAEFQNILAIRESARKISEFEETHPRPEFN